MTISKNAVLARHSARMIACHLWRGDVDELKVYVDLLSGIIEEDPPSSQHIEDEFWQTYVNVKRCLVDGSSIVPWRCVQTDDWDISYEVAETRVRQKDIVDQMVIGIGDLLNAKNPIIVTEHRIGDGAVDVTVHDGDVLHLIEVKSMGADHSCVGQIAKYMRWAGGRIHLGHYTKIVGWVAAPSITDDAMVELKAIGVRTIRIVPVRRDTTC